MMGSLILVSIFACLETFIVLLWISGAERQAEDDRFCEHGDVAKGEDK